MKKIRYYQISLRCMNSIKKAIEKNPKHEMLLAGKKIYGKGNYVRTHG